MTGVTRGSGEEPGILVRRSPEALPGCLFGRTGRRRGTVASTRQPTQPDTPVARLMALRGSWLISKVKASISPQACKMLPSGLSELMGLTPLGPPCVELERILGTRCPDVRSSFVACCRKHCGAHVREFDLLPVCRAVVCAELVTNQVRRAETLLML